MIASEPLVEVTERHVGSFARQGLRTLCMAKRVSESIYVLYDDTLSLTVRSLGSQ